MDNNGEYIVYDSIDLINWRNGNILKAPGNDNMRHFTPIVLISDQYKNIIKNLILSCKEDAFLYIN